MSTESTSPVEPFTITITTSIGSGEEQYLLARSNAAAHFQLNLDDVVCLQYVGPVETIPAAVILDHDGNPITPIMYRFTSKWAPKAQPEVRQRHPRTLWPSVKLSRGARWQGSIPDDDGNPVDAMLISTGTKLVHLDSPEGVAILLDLTPATPETEGPAL